MKEFKGTEGDFVVSVDESHFDYRPHIYTSDFLTIVGIVDGYTKEEREANARLFAASKKMMEALHAILEEIPNPTLPVTKRIKELAEQALNEAL